MATWVLERPFIPGTVNGAARYRTSVRVPSDIPERKNDMANFRPLAIALAAATMLSPFAAHAQPAAAPAPLPAQPAPLANPNAKADADQNKVLDALQTLGAKGVEELTVAQARAQPTPADAVRKVLGETGKPNMPVPVLATKEVKYPAGKGQQPARIYLAPKGAANPPVILYFHGGGWVIADINTYDAGARALARETGAIVVSAEYRHAPEDKFPASGWRWRARAPAATWR
jgi:acetyl esterase